MGTSIIDESAKKESKKKSARVGGCVSERECVCVCVRERECVCV